MQFSYKDNPFAEEQQMPLHRKCVKRFQNITTPTYLQHIQSETTAEITNLRLMMHVTSSCWDQQKDYICVTVTVKIMSNVKDPQLKGDFACMSNL